MKIAAPNVIYGVLESLETKLEGLYQYQPKFHLLNLNLFEVQRRGDSNPALCAEIFHVEFTRML